MRSWRSIISVVSAVAAFVGGCASAPKPPLQADGLSPAAECQAYPDNVAPDGPRVFLVPRPPLPNLPRCSVANLALATHDLGQFRAVYGDDTPIAPGSAIEPVINDLRDKAPVYCHPEKHWCVFRIIIFAHGGLVGQAQAVSDAEALAPAMMLDGYAPVFLIWNSDIETAYGDRLCCVLDGEADHNRAHQIYFSPVRAAGDIGAGVTRTMENIGQELIRYDRSVLKHHGTEYFLTDGDVTAICNLLRD
jgi:hypothetical protein